MNPAAPAANPRRLRSIDMLRGVAILLVLAIHIPHYAPGGWRINPWFFPSFLAEFGYLGVPLFIVISGFCIHRGAAATRAASGSYRFDWAQFWKRRFIRLYPPYLAAIVLSIASASWLHSRFGEPTRLLGWDLGTHLLLVHNLTAEFSTSLGNGAFWSLGTEEQLYALYFVLLALLTRASPRMALAVVAGVTILWRVLMPLVGDPGVHVGPFHLGSWYQWPFHYWLHWALGAFAVDAWLGNWKLPAWSASGSLGSAFLALGLLLNRNTFELVSHSHAAIAVMVPSRAESLAILHNLGELLALLGFFCLMNRALLLEARNLLSGIVPRALAWVGRISYSLYLVHVPVVYALEEHFPMGDSAVAWPLRYVFYGTVAMVAGFLFHQGVERWFLHGRLPRFGAPARAVIERVQ
jgi:peptidoglycan/LPS O-acetylase OafA/YrhL